MKAFATKVLIGLIALNCFLAISGQSLTAEMRRIIAHYRVKSPLVSEAAFHSHALSQPRIYCCRSTQKFTADEEQRVVQRYHACWTVLKER
jgi:hypothetical protein